MRGILMVGGVGSRLRPVTLAVNKHLLPVYDRPMVHYALSSLLLAGVRDILVITTPGDAEVFRHLLGDGDELGISLSYAVQRTPRGSAEALDLGAGPGDQQVCLALGDNIFHGPSLQRHLARLTGTSGAGIFACRTADPTASGVVEIDQDGRALSIEEKPDRPRSDLAVPGFYVYPADAVDIARGLHPSARGELEISDLNRVFLQSGRLHVEVLSPDVVWFDVGTFDALHDAATLARRVQEDTGRRVGVPEEAAWRSGFLSDADLHRRAEELRDTYGPYLLDLLDEA